jgi:hypothetical protein
MMESRPLSSEYAPLSLAPLIDKAFSILRSHYGKFFLLLLLGNTFSYIPLRLLLSLWAIAPTAPIPAMLFQIVLFGAVLFFCFLIYYLAIGACILGFFSVIFDEPFSVWNSFREVFKRSARLLIAVVLAWILQIIAYLIGLIPGLGIFVLSLQTRRWGVVLAGFLFLLLSLAPGLIVFIYLIFTPHEVLLEGRSAPEALSRSFRLMRHRKKGEGMLAGNVIKATVIFTLILAVSIGIQSIVWVSSGAAAVYYYLERGGLEKENFDPANPFGVPPRLLVLFEFLGIGVRSSYQPFAVIAVALFYLDVRARKEGFDLELRLNRISSEKGAS